MRKSSRRTISSLPPSDSIESLLQRHLGRDIAHYPLEHVRGLRFKDKNEFERVVIQLMDGPRLKGIPFEFVGLYTITVPLDFISSIKQIASNFDELRVVPATAESRARRINRMHPWTV